MSKKHSTTTVESEEVVETPATESENPVETTSETETTEETPSESEEVDATSTESEAPVVETETPAETTESAEETPVETPTVESEEVVETPVETITEVETTVETPATESDASADPEDSSKELTDHERDVKASEEFMAKRYNVRYAPDTNSKRFAILKTMSMLEIYNMFVNKRTKYVALTSNDDFIYVRDFFNEHPVYFYNVEVGSIARVQFLNRLKSYTDYAVVRWGKK